MTSAGAFFSTATGAMIQNAIKNYPHLSHETETELFRKWKNSGDEKAANRLVMSHMALMVSMVRKLSGYNLPPDDLLGQAIIGIMKALERFEPERGFRFNTFARSWIFESMMTWIMNNRSMLRGPSTASSKTLFFNLNRVRKKLNITGNMTREEAERVRDILVDELPGSAGMTVEAVLENERFLGTAVISADAPRGDDEESSGILDFLKDPSELQDSVYDEREEKQIGHSLLEQAISNCLTPRQERIIRGRRLSEPPLTLEELAGEYGISRERIRQIEVSAFLKVQSEVRSLIEDRRTDARSRQEAVRLEAAKRAEEKARTHYTTPVLRGISNPILMQSDVSAARKRSEATRRGNITRGAERRREITIKGNLTRGPERRREISLKAAATVRARKAAAAAAENRNIHLMSGSNSEKFQNRPVFA